MAKVGRPSLSRRATGATPVMTARVPQRIKARFTVWARRQGLDRSEALRRLIEEAVGKKPARK
jgi:hypothetical protein